MKKRYLFQISVHIRSLLNGYMKPDCKVGKITNKDDYKFLAKKVKLIVEVYLPTLYIDIYILIRAGTS